MSKKFVPLSSCITPADNPYNVKTFNYDDAVPIENIPDGYYQEQPYTCCEGVFGAPPYCKPDAPVTVADEIYNLYRRAQDNKRTQTVRQECKKSCCPTDDYYKCVKLQKTPCQLNTHALIREKLLMVQKRDEQRIHDFQEQLEETNCLVALDSPIIVKGKNAPKESCHHVTPKRASPPVSALILPTKRMAIDQKIFACDDDAGEANQHYGKQDQNSQNEEFVKSDLETLMRAKGGEEKSETIVKKLLKSRNEFESVGTYKRNNTPNPTEILSSESVTNLWIKEVIDENKNRFRMGNLCIKENSGDEEEVELRLTNITEDPQNPQKDLKREIMNQLKENEKLLRYDYGSWKAKLANGSEKNGDKDEDFLAKELIRNLKRKLLLNRILKEWDITQTNKNNSNLETAPELDANRRKMQENDSKKSKLFLDIDQKEDGKEVERNLQEQESLAPSDVNLQMTNFFSNIFDRKLVHPEVQEVLRIIEEMNTDDELHNLGQEVFDQNNSSVKLTETAQAQNFMNEDLIFDTTGVTENERPEVDYDTRNSNTNIEEGFNRQKVLTKREEALLFGKTCIQNISKVKMDVKVHLKNIAELKRKERKKKAAFRAEKEKSNQNDKNCIQKRKRKESEAFKEGKNSTMKIKQKVENNRGITAVHISNKPAGVKKNLRTDKNLISKNVNLNIKKASKHNIVKKSDANQSCMNMKLRLRNIFEKKDPEIFAWSEEKEIKSKRATSAMFIDQKRKNKEKKATVMEKLWKNIDKKSKKKTDMKTISQSQILEDILNHSSETKEILEDYMLVERENQIRKTASQWIMEQTNIENNEKLKVKQILEQERKFRESLLNSKIMDLLSVGSLHLSKENVKEKNQMEREREQNIINPLMKANMNIDSIKLDLQAQKIFKEFTIRSEIMEDQEIPEWEKSVIQKPDSSSLIEIEINDICNENLTDLLVKEEIPDEQYSRIEKKQTQKVKLSQEYNNSLLPMDVFEQKGQIVKFNINDIILTGKMKLCVNGVFFEIFHGEDFGQNYQVELNRKENFLANKFVSQYRYPLEKGCDLRDRFLVSNLLVFSDFIDNARSLKGIEKERRFQIKNTVEEEESAYDNNFIEKFDSESKIYKVTTHRKSWLKNTSEQKVPEPTAKKEVQIELLHRMQSLSDSETNSSAYVNFSEHQPAVILKQNFQVPKVRQCENQMTGAKLEERFEENKLPRSEFSNVEEEELQETKSNLCINEPVDTSKSDRDNAFDCDEILNNNCNNGNGDSNVKDLLKSENNIEKLILKQEHQQEIINEHVETLSENFLVLESTDSIYKWLGKDVSKKLCNLKDEGLKTKIATTIETILQEDWSPERLASDEDISEKDSDSSEYGSCSFYHSCLTSSETSVTYV